MGAIYKREMRAYFTSPIGYIFMAMFLAMSGVLFSLLTFGTRSSDTSMYFLVLLFVFVIVIPLLTMKLLSEERKLKTEQILLTSPVSLSGIIYAKFFAAFTMFAITFLLSEGIHMVCLSIYANSTSASQVLGNIIGILLVGGAFISVGLFLSSLTSSQIIAAISTIGVILLMMLTSTIADTVGNHLLRVVIKWFAITSRFAPFTAGIFSLASILYYVSIIVIFLFLTVRVYEKRRWG